MEFNIDRSVPLYQSTTAQIRYSDLIGNRYVELKRVRAGQRSAAARWTHPIVPHVTGLGSGRVDRWFQAGVSGVGSREGEQHRQRAHHRLPGARWHHKRHPRPDRALTSQIAERDQAIGEVVKNLNIVLDTTVKHRKEFDETVNNLENLITGLRNHSDQLAGGLAHISNGAGTVADLLAENRTLVRKAVSYLDAIQQPVIDQRVELDDLLHKTPTALTALGRANGTYGDFQNFYLCDLQIKWNGFQAGGPVRTVKLFSQPTGRCTPQ